MTALSPTLPETEGCLGLPVVPAESARNSAASAALSEAPASLVQAPTRSIDVELPITAEIPDAERIALANAVRLASWKFTTYARHRKNCTTYSVLGTVVDCECGLTDVVKAITDAARTMQGVGLVYWKVLHEGKVWSLLPTPDGPAWRAHG